MALQFQRRATAHKVLQASAGPFGEPETRGLQRSLEYKRAYPDHQVVILESSPGEILFDPGRVKKDFIFYSRIQGLQVRVEVPRILVNFCPFWRVHDALA